ncbi:GTPase domain-containing protein [Microbacterium lacticum]|uniref:GTPase domain-containing protein n=1 Tax=Microbacterium lacticum TaxID=33885 RepID=UPI00242F93ED|nr:GTPase domain-containing protein [Microbacterium lacticum]
MTEILIHEIPAATRELQTRLVTVLQDIGGEDAGRLVELLGQIDRRRPRLVLTGQFSTGKSMLINALTDNPALARTGADFVTDEIKEYEWGHEVVIVDTPGVQSGVREHTQKAEDAIIAADLLLFAVTPDLLDDAGEEHLRDVAIKYAKFDQMIVVVTMKNTMGADPGVRQDAIDRALGDGRHPVVVECDARDYLQGGEFVPISGIDELRSAINALTERSGQLAVERQPIQLIMSTAAEATALLVADPQEGALLRLLAQRRKALTGRFMQIEVILGDLRQQFRARAGRSAEDFADRLDSLDQGDLVDAQRELELEAAQRRLDSDLTMHDEWLVHSTEEALDSQFADLGSEVASMERGPQARTVAELTDLAVEVKEPRRAALSIGGGTSRRKLPAMANMPAFVSKIPEWSTKFVEQWGAGQGRNLADSSGTFGHTAVKGLASRLGIKLKPWQAVKTADKVGRVAKHANKIGVALNILEGGKVVIDEIAQLQAERRRQSRRRTVVNGVMSEAERAATDLHADVRAQIDAEFRPYIAEIDGLRGQVVAAQENRSAASLELEQIGLAARDLLDSSREEPPRSSDSRG